MGRGWALWMPDLKRVALAKVMKYCRRITGTRIMFMGRGERERGAGTSRATGRREKEENCDLGE